MVRVDQVGHIIFIGVFGRFLRATLAGEAPPNEGRQTDHLGNDSSKDLSDELSDDLSDDLNGEVGVRSRRGHPS